MFSFAPVSGGVCRKPFDCTQIVNARFQFIPDIRHSLAALQVAGRRSDDHAPIGYLFRPFDDLI